MFLTGTHVSEKAISVSNSWIGIKYWVIGRSVVCSRKEVPHSILFCNGEYREFYYFSFNSDEGVTRNIIVVAEKVGRARFPNGQKRSTLNFGKFLGISFEGV